jgi:hypothetical protein
MARTSLRRKVGECANTHSADTRYSWGPQRRTKLQEPTRLQCTYTGKCCRHLNPSDPHTLRGLTGQVRSPQGTEVCSHFMLQENLKPCHRSHQGSCRSVLSSALPEYPHRPMSRVFSRGRSSLIGREPRINRPCAEVNCHQTGNFRFLSFCLRPGTAADLVQESGAPSPLTAESYIGDLCPSCRSWPLKPSGPFGSAYICTAAHLGNPGAFTLLPPKRRKRKEGGG